MTGLENTLYNLCHLTEYHDKSYSRVSIIIFGIILRFVLIINRITKLLNKLNFNRSDIIRYVEYDTSGYIFSISYTLSNVDTLIIVCTHLSDSCIISFKSSLFNCVLKGKPRISSTDVYVGTPLIQV